MAKGRGSEAEGRNLFMAYQQIHGDIGFEAISLLIRTSAGRDTFNSLLMTARDFLLRKDMRSYHSLLDEYRGR